MFKHYAESGKSKMGAVGVVDEEDGHGQKVGGTYDKKSMVASKRKDDGSEFSRSLCIFF